MRARPNRLWLTSRWGWKLIWQESTGLFLGVALVTVVRGVLPAAIALVVRGLIDTAVEVTGSGSTGIESLLPWLLGGFLLASLEAVAQFTNSYLMLRLGDDLNIRITTDIMSHATGMDLEFFEDPRRRDLIERTRQNTGARLARLVAETQATLTNLIQIVTLLGVLVFIEPLVIVVVPPFAIPFLFFQWRLAKKRYREEHLRATKRRWTKYYMSLVTGPYSVAEVRLLDLGPLLVERFRRLMTQFRDRDRKLHLMNFTGSSVTAFLTIAAAYGLLVRVALLAVSGGATIGDLAIFGGAVARLRIALDRTIRSLSIAFEQVLFIANLREFLSVAPDIKSGSRIPREQGGVSVALRNVSFTYPGSTQPVLRDMCLEIESGETLAIVGENGAGKSTVAKLLARLYDPDAGQVLFDGVDVREWRIDDLHRRIGFVFQSFGRFEGTVADNIAYGDWRSLLDNADGVRAVAQAARVDSFVGKLEDSYETVIGRQFGKVDLSGGEWQQLAVARACARDASLLILDEPTSNLDARAEYELFARFKELARGRTTILISHRFTTLSMADRIVVLAEGQIAESGSHEQLLASSGVYAALYNLHARLLRPPQRH